MLFNIYNNNNNNFRKLRICLLLYILELSQQNFVIDLFIATIILLFRWL